MSNNENTPKDSDSQNNTNISDTEEEANLRLLRSQSKTSNQPLLPPGRLSEVLREAKNKKSTITFNPFEVKDKIPRESPDSSYLLQNPLNKNKETTEQSSQNIEPSKTDSFAQNSLTEKHNSSNFYVPLPTTEDSSSSNKQLLINTPNIASSSTNEQQLTSYSYKPIKPEIAGTTANQEEIETDSEHESETRSTNSAYNENLTENISTDDTDNQSINQNNRDNLRNPVIMPQTIKINDALKFVNDFDGNRPVEVFLDEVENGSMVLVAADRPTYLLMLKSKLKGEPLQTTNGINFANLDAFKQHFRDLYRPKETYTQLQLKLASIYQFPNETIVTYKIRVSDLTKRIRQAYITEHAPEAADLERFNAALQRDELYYFKDGLSDQIRLALGDVNTLEAAASRAHKLDLEMKAREAKREKIQPTFHKLETNAAKILTCQICNEENTHVAKFCPFIKQNKEIKANEEIDIQTTESKIHAIINEKLNKLSEAKDRKSPMRCTYCNKLYHEENDCFLKEKHRNNIAQNSNTISPQPNANPQQMNSRPNYRNTPICLYCNIRGHVIKDCRKKMANDNMNSANYNASYTNYNPRPTYNRNAINYNNQVNDRSIPNHNRNNYQNRNTYYNQNSNPQTSRPPFNNNSNQNNSRRYNRTREFNNTTQSKCAYCKEYGHHLDQCPILAQKFSNQENYSRPPTSSGATAGLQTQRPLELSERR